MNDKTQAALKLALEALECVRTQDMELVQRSMLAITAIREALAEQPAPSPNEGFEGSLRVFLKRPNGQWERLETIEQANAFTRQRLTEQPAQQQEPVAWLIDNNYTTVFRDIEEAHRNKGAKVEPLYTSPPASKPWVGLTDEEIEEVWRRVQANDFHDCVQPFARAIEAKLKAKNT